MARSNVFFLVCLASVCARQQCESPALWETERRNVPLQTTGPLGNSEFSEFQQSPTPPHPSLAFITAIFGTYEAAPWPFAPQNADFICFTDREDFNRSVNGWIIDTTPYHLDPRLRPLDHGGHVNSATRNNHPFYHAKFYKQCFHRIPRLQHYKIIVWIDASVEITQPVAASYLAQLFHEHDGVTVATWDHPTRRGGLATEAAVSMRYKKYAETAWLGHSQPYQDVDAQFQAYRAMGYSDAHWHRVAGRGNEDVSHSGVWMTCFVAFDFRSERTRQLLDLWYLQTLKYSTQDQVSFPFACWLLGVTPYTWFQETVLGVGESGGFATGNISLFSKHAHGDTPRTVEEAVPPIPPLSSEEGLSGLVLPCDFVGDFQVQVSWTTVYISAVDLRSFGTSYIQLDAELLGLSRNLCMNDTRLILSAQATWDAQFCAIEIFDAALAAFAHQCGVIISREERVQLIRQPPAHLLTDRGFLENLILALGVNDENPHELPSIVLQNAGGLRIYQYPTQFSGYLQLLSGLQVTSYLEIGCRWGGTFILTTEYLERFETLTRSVAVDLIDSPVKAYCNSKANTEFLRLDSSSASFEAWLMNADFDAIFIDGDHSYEGVKRDFELVRGRACVYVFHDIVSHACPGVVRFWLELKQAGASEYEFHEFTGQYTEVFERQHRSYFGIGVAIQKDRQLHGCGRGRRRIGHINDA